MNDDPAKDTQTRNQGNISLTDVLQVAVEKEPATYLKRDYYERNEGATESRNGSKPRTVKIGREALGYGCRR